MKVTNNAKGDRVFTIHDGKEDRLGNRPTRQVSLMPGQTADLDLAAPDNPVNQGMVDSGEIEIAGVSKTDKDAAAPYVSADAAVIASQSGGVRNPVTAEGVPTPVPQGQEADQGGRRARVKRGAKPAGDAPAASRGRKARARARA